MEGEKEGDGRVERENKSLFLYSFSSLPLASRREGKRRMQRGRRGRQMEGLRERGKEGLRWREGRMEGQREEKYRYVGRKKNRKRD